MLFEFLISWIRSIINYFYKPIAMEENGQKIYIKWQTGVIPLYLQEDWTVADAKKGLSKKINISFNELHLIFAGKELHDDVKLQDCGIEEQTVLHAVPSRKLPLEVTKSTNISCSDFCEDNEDSNYVKGSSQSKKSYFFVYCAGACKGMRPGKLRVRCSACRDGTLTVSKDPTCWEDVLIPSRVPGMCHNVDCDGTIAEFYFKCSGHIDSTGDSCVPLNLIRNNFKNVPCIACTDTKAVILVFPCSDGHVICVECFELYCIAYLNERKFIQDETVGYTINCAAGCPDSLIVEPHHFKLLGEEQYSRYQRFGAEECLLQAGGVLCPRVGCGAGLLPDDVCRRIVCSAEGGAGCGFVFCRYCLQSYHIGSCDTERNYESNSFGHSITDERAGTSRWDEASRTIIQETTKPCPSCRTPTERDGGCMHMVCTRSTCGFHWCWICQEEWTRDCMGAHWFG